MEYEAKASKVGGQSVVSGRPRRIPRRAWWTVAALTLVSTLDWADRALISVVADPLKDEFRLSDAELGFLMGVAFVAVRAFVGVPVGRLADKWNRRNLVAIAVAVISAANLAFGSAKNYMHVILARIGVGVGTSGTSPPAMSMIADLFPLSRRGLAIGIYNTGGTVGWSIGVAAAGWITHMYGWRTTMYAFGIFGIVVATLFLVLVREPKRSEDPAPGTDSSVAPSIRQVIKFVLGQRSLLHIAMGFSLILGVDMTIAIWSVTFFVRTHELSLSAAGGTYGLVLLIGGAPGTLFGGYLLDILGKRDVRWHCWLMLIASLTVATLAFGIYLVPSGWVAMTLVAFNAFILGLVYAPSNSITVNLAPGRMRGFVFSAVTVAFFAGYAFLPWYTGYVSTLLEPNLGIESLRYALLSGSVFLVWAAAHFFFASRSIEGDYERAGTIPGDSSI